MNQSRINIVVSESLWIKIKKTSQEQDRSLSYVIRQALTEQFMPKESSIRGAQK